MARLALLLAGGASLVAAAPAAAQFFMKSPVMTTEAARGDEPGATPMPDATEAEMRAGLVWNLRAALNVAALQCQFEPTLNTVNNYNAMLLDHKDELKAANDTLTKYFIRLNKTKAAGLAAYDQFGTRIYSGFSTVAGQYGFCQTAASIGGDVIHAPRGGMSEVAVARMRELRASLQQWSEQQFPRYWPQMVSLPRMDPDCFTKQDYWDYARCGEPRYADAPTPAPVASVDGAAPVAAGGTIATASAR